MSIKISENHRRSSKKVKEKLLFGTDGIRGVANQYPMTAEIALTAGRAAALFCKQSGGTKKPKIVIGRDTRVSGRMIEYALISGCCSAGGDVYAAGVIPTPGVAYITRHLNADAGIVVSASHNPYFDNGIKFFNHKGFKLSDQKEAQIEALILSEKTSNRFNGTPDTGDVRAIPDADIIYSHFLKHSVDGAKPFDGLKIVMDCSNGATYKIAPALFSDLGAQVLPMAVSPDGYNINRRCGSQHPERLAEKVIECSADIGIAFDGDGDRMIAVDETGAILSGDQLLAVFANYFLNFQLLENHIVVSTVMSNIGLTKTLAGMGIHHIMSAVGDRYVMEQMITSGANLGGEDSGHIILLSHHTTGDGILAAIQLLAVMQRQALPLSRLADIMKVFPQKLMNVTVNSKPDIYDLPEIKQAIEYVENSLKDTGRVLVRYSGTQPVCRVMVEASSMEEADRYCEQIVNIIKKHLGG